MKKVYLLWHKHIVSEDDDLDDSKLVGVYSSRPQAEAAIDRKKQFEGFRDFPNGFEIDEYELDRDAWSEGFISIEEALSALKTE